MSAQLIWTNEIKQCAVCTIQWRYPSQALEWFTYRCSVDKVADAACMHNLCLLIPRRLGLHTDPSHAGYTVVSRMFTFPRMVFFPESRFPDGHYPG